MGMGNNRSGFNAPHQWVTGWTEDEAVYELDAGASAIVYLIPGEAEPTARYPGLFKGIRVTKGYRGHYFIGLFEGELRLYRSEAGRRFQQTTMLQAHRYNSTPPRPVDDQPSMRIVGRRDGVTKVEVRWSDATPAPVDRPYPAAPLPDNPLPLVSGLYHEPQYEHQGFDLWAFEDRTAMYWYTGDQQGEPVWYLCHQDAAPQGDVRTLEIKDPARPDFAVIGRMTMYCERPNVLTLHYSFDDGRMGKVEARLLAEKSPGATLYAYDGMERSGLSENLTGERKIAYVFETLARRTRWYLAFDGSLKEAKGMKLRMETASGLTPRGAIRWDDTKMQSSHRTALLTPTARLPVQGA